MVIITTVMRITDIAIMSITVITATIIFIITMEDRYITGTRILTGRFNAERLTRNAESLKLPLK